MKIFFVILFAACSFLYGQCDWVRWEGQQISYELPSKKDGPAHTKVSGFGPKIVLGAKIIYKTLFSDLDGDNCPFHPSCSQFFVDAVYETNFLKGTLMFADRFTRDLNFLKGLNNYEKYSSNKFFDPAVNYCLDQKKINLQPSINSAK